jgi:ribonuclease J
MHIPSNIYGPARQSERNDPKEIVIVTTGSQGEPMSSVTRMAMGDHKSISLQPDDMVLLSARTIPGNERAISNIINHALPPGRRGVV